MFHAAIRAFGAVLLPLLLTGCFLSPGKFTSTLTVNKDRTFSFSYVGEVIAVDIGKEMTDGLSKEPDGKSPETGSLRSAPGADDAAKTAAAKQAEFDRKCRAIAEALNKEAGYKSVAYVGGGKFNVDYAIAGTLTHNFVYPFNLDAEAVFPFIVIELRADGRVRVKAPAFATDKTKLGEMPMGDAPGSQADGTFTLDTDAEIVSQNNEAGAVAGAGGRKRVVWVVTPLSKEAPVAVLGVK